MHDWGDENVDWDGIDAAARFIGRGLLKWRVNVQQYKEKFGTVRVYCTFGISSWTQLTHPGYAFNQWPTWLNFIAYPGEHSIFRYVLRVVNPLVVPLHIWLYKWYYREAIRRWPHLQEEILRGADWHEHLGGAVKYQTIYWPELGDPEPEKPSWWKEGDNE